MSKKKIKKFKDYSNVNFDRIVESKLTDMTIGLDLTKLRSDDYVREKTIEYINEHK